MELFIPSGGAEALLKEGGVRMNTTSRIKIGRGFSIVDGPARGELVDAFKYALDKNAKVAVSFEVSGEDIFKTEFITVRSILMMEHADDSGRAFVVRGYCQPFYVAAFEPEKLFKAVFDTKTRRGSLEILE